MRRIGVITLGVILLIGLTPAGAVALTAQEELGKNIFFDQNLSINKNQSCAACHKPESGWTGPDGTPSRLALTRRTVQPLRIVDGSYAPIKNIENCFELR